MRLRREGDHWLLVGGPVPPGSAAITIGSVISIRRRALDSPRLLRHEAVHVRQWCTLGATGFLGRYLASYVGWRLRGYPHWAAYRRIPLEVEAAWESRTAPDTVPPTP